VTVKLPVVVGPGVNMTMPTRRTQGRPNPAQASESKDGRRSPAPTNFTPTILVQVAREAGQRDRAMAEFRETYDTDLHTVRVEAAQAKRDLLNRLVLICIATIAGTALGVTWISRQSL